MGKKSENSKVPSAPISTHAAFPAIVAMWFAALLGIGSFVLPISIVEQIVSATGIASLVPAAAPPLGVTAKLALSLGAALVGALIGFVLARKIAASHAEKASSPRVARKTEKNTVRPLSAREDLGLDSLDQPDGPAPSTGQQGQRRRSLAVTEENQRSEFLDFAPLPGAEYTYGAPAHLTAEIEPLELETEVVEIAGNEAADPAPEVVTEEAASAPRRFDAPGETFAEPVDDPLADLRNEVSEPIEAEFEEAASEEAEPAILAEPEFEAPVVAEMDAPRPFDMPAEPAADAGETELAATFEDEAEPEPLPEPEKDNEAEPVAMHMSNIEPADEQPADRSLDELTMVQLVERFAKALQGHRSRASAAPVQVQQEFAVPQAFAPDAEPEVAEEPKVEAEETAPVEAEAANLNVPPIPAALRPIDAGYTLEDEEEDEDGEAFGDSYGPFTLKLNTQSRRFATSAEQAEEFAQAASAEAGEAETETEVPEAAQAAEDATTEEPVDLDFAAFSDADDDGDEDGAEDDHDAESYSSLLDMKRPLGAGREFVRIDDDADEACDDAPEPIVVFPGQSQRRAAPAADGPARSGEEGENTATPAARKFDAPGEAAPAPIPGQAPSPTRVRAEETERALREALEKLQRMSGAA